MTDAVIWTRGKGITHLEKLPGYVRSEALAINNAGIVVGMIDGPHASATGPNAFVYEKGRLRIFNEFGPSFARPTAINDAGQVAGDLDKEDVGRVDAGGSKAAGPEKACASGRAEVSGDTALSP